MCTHALMHSCGMVGLCMGKKIDLEYVSVHTYMHTYLHTHTHTHTHAHTYTHTPVKADSEHRAPVEQSEREHTLRTVDLPKGGTNDRCHRLMARGGTNCCCHRLMPRGGVGMELRIIFSTIVYAVCRPLIYPGVRGGDFCGLTICVNCGIARATGMLSPNKK